MSQIASRLEEMLARARADVEAASDLAALDSARVAYLGKKGELTEILRGPPTSVRRSARPPTTFVRPSKGRWRSGVPCCRAAR